MNLELTDEQRMLGDSAAALVERELTFEQRSRALADAAPLNEPVWRQFADLGWLGAGVSEAAGGFGGGAVEHLVVCEALGRAMVLEPFVSTAVIGAHALAQADDAASAGALLAELVAGNWRAALAYAERDGRFDLHHVAMRARHAGNRVVLDGDKLAVLDAPSATALLVSARASGDTRDEHGIGLYLVDADAAGVARQDYRTPDGRPAASIRLTDCEAVPLVAPERGLAVLNTLVERAIAARCAEAAGAMQASFEHTLEYMKTREQFGVAIGSFQVIQHRLVDMLMQVRECRAVALMVANEVMDDDAHARATAVSAAKTFVGRRARRVAHEIVQLHGGVGMTEELAIGHYFRYLTQFCSSYGSTDHHHRRYAALTV